MTTTTSSTASDIYAALNGTSSSSSSSSKSSSSTSASDQQTQFLLLLTTQLQNQDPLNPMDNAQMTSQLAQISTVQGITQLNTSLQTVLDNINANQAVQAAGLIGKAALVPGSGLQLSSSKAVGGYELASNADAVTVTISDSKGNAVRTMSMDSSARGSGLNAFSWDGKNDAGETVADGTYTISVAATQGGSKVDVTALQLGTVSSVSGTGSSMKINVSGIGSFSVSDIREIL